MKYLFLSLFIFLASGTKAQTFKLSDDVIKGKIDNCVYLGQSTDSVFLLRENYHYYSVTKPITASIIITDSNLNLISNKKITLIHKDKELRLIKVLKDTSGVYVFAAFYNQKHIKDYLFVKRMKFTGKSTEEWKMIAETPLTVIPKEYNSLGSSNYLISRSPDKSKFAVYSKEQFLKSANKTFFSVHVYNKDFEEISSSRKHIEGKLIMGLDCQLIINNKGDFFVSMVRSNKRIKDYYFKFLHKDFFVFNSKSSESKSFLQQILIPGKTVSSLVIATNNSGEFFLGGYYSNIGFASIKGSFITKLEGDSLLIKRMEDFSTGLIKSNPMPKTIYTHYPDEMIRYHANSLYINNSGDFLLLGELIYQHSSYFNNNSKALFYDSPELLFYDFSNILIERGKFSGEYSWLTVPKLQVYPLHPWVSYSSFYDFKHLVLVFNHRNNALIWGMPKGIAKIVVFDENLNKISENQTNGILFVNSQIYFPEKINRQWYSIIKKNKKMHIIKLTNNE